MLKTHGALHEFPELILHVDGGCEGGNPGGVAVCGWAIFAPVDLVQPLAEEGRIVTRGKLATCNVAEYGGLGFALTHLLQQNWRGSLIVKGDSRLLIEQIRGAWQCKADHLRKLRDSIWRLMDRLQLHRVTSSEPLVPEGLFPCHLVWVPREKNEYADGLGRIAYREYLEQP